jgi:hypothetical protein
MCNGRQLKFDWDNEARYQPAPPILDFGDSSYRETGQCRLYRGYPVTGALKALFTVLQCPPQPRSSQKSTPDAPMKTPRSVAPLCLLYTRGMGRCGSSDTFPAQVPCNILEAAIRMAPFAVFLPQRAHGFPRRRHHHHHHHHHHHPPTLLRPPFMPWAPKTGMRPQYYM